MPSVFFKRLFRVLRPIEIAVLGNLTEMTVGRSEGEVTWAMIAEAEMARVVGCHVNAVSRALDILEQLGLIEGQRAARDKRKVEYRVRIERWETVQEREARRVERSVEAAPEASEDAEAGTEEAMEASVSMELTPALKAGKLTEVLVLLPGSATPRPLREVCPHGGACALVQLHENGGAKNKQSVLQTKAESDLFTTRPCGDPDPDYREFRTVVKGLEGKLQQVAPEALLKQQWERLKAAGIPFEVWLTRFRLRSHKFQSFGFLPCLVDDVLAAAAHARAAAAEVADAGSSGLADAVRRKLNEAAAALKKKPAYGEIARIVAAMAKEADVWAEDFERLDLELANLTVMMRTIAEHSLTPAVKAGLESEVLKRCGAMRARLTQEAWGDLRDKTFQSLLFEQAGLPRLTVVL